MGADLQQIDVDVLEPFDIQLLAGRAFDSRDIDRDSRPVIVNHTFARRLIDGGNAVGHRIRERRDSNGPGPWLEIVGVISDFPAPATQATADAMIYPPAGRGEAQLVLLAIRVRGGRPATFSHRLREIVASVDRDLQLTSIMPMDELLWRMDTELRLVASVSGLITLSVLLLSATGLYALMAFTVTQRRREIGLRMALGANPFRLLITIMSRSFAQLTIGITIGSAIAAVMLGRGRLPARTVWRCCQAWPRSCCWSGSWPRPRRHVERFAFSRQRHCETSRRGDQAPRVVPCWLRRDGNPVQAVPGSWSIRRRKVAIWFQLVKVRLTTFRVNTVRNLRSVNAQT